MMLDAQVWLMDGQQRRVVRIKGSETEKKDNPIPDHAGKGAAKRNEANLARARMPNATCPLDDMGFKPCMALSVKKTVL